LPEFEDVNLDDATARGRRGADHACEAGIPVTARAAVGAPTWETILDTADEIDAGVIVMGSRGLSGVRERLEGSLSHELSVHSHGPVLVVPPNGRHAMKNRRLSDESLAGVVTAKLYWDALLDARTIAVAANDGTVTLRGTVGTLAAKREAKAAAARVPGVVSVDDELQVGPLDSDGAESDAKVRADIPQALMLNRVVPPAVDVQVENGVATLSGSVDWPYQRAEAERLASAVDGVVQVVDGISIVHPAANRSNLG
jgi:osmotically-inducible protein OsmY